jgi:hypothetical protein
MKKLIGLSLAVAFLVLLCQVAICQEVPRTGRAAAGQRPAMTEEQRAEMQKAMQALRDLNAKLRDAEAKARQDTEVVKAFEAVTKAEEAANKALDAAIIKANPDLEQAVKERRSLLQKLGELGVGRFTRGGMRTGAPRGGRGRTGGGGAGS